MAETRTDDVAGTVDGEEVSVKEEETKAGSKRNGGAAARARADARKAARARARKLEELSVRFDKLEADRESARAKRDEKIARATERADAAMAETVEAARSGQDEVMREALALEGVRPKDVAEWMGLSTRAVNEWRRRLEESTSASETTTQSAGA